MYSNYGALAVSSQAHYSGTFPHGRNLLELPLTRVVSLVALRGFFCAHSYRAQTSPRTPSFEGYSQRSRWRTLTRPPIPSEPGATPGGSQPLGIRPPGALVDGNPRGGRSNPWSSSGQVVEDGSPVSDDQPVSSIREELQVTARQRGRQPLGFRWWDGSIL